MSKNSTGSTSSVKAGVNTDTDKSTQVYLERPIVFMHTDSAKVTEADSLSARSHNHEGQKSKSKLHRCGEYDINEASKYFESSDFIQMGQEILAEVGATDSRDGVSDNRQRVSDGRYEGIKSHSDDESDCDHDSDSSGEPGRTRVRTGSYDLLVEPGNFDRHYVDISAEIDDRDSEFDSCQECSSISVTESESEFDADDEPYEHHDVDKEEYFTGNDQLEDVYTSHLDKCHTSESTNSDDLSLPRLTLRQESSSTREIPASSDHEKHGTSKTRIMDTDTQAVDARILDTFSLHEDIGESAITSDAGSDHSEEEVSETDGEKVDHHSLIRKPAMRRKGYAWASKTLPRYLGNDVIRHRQVEGSSLEIAPTLLGLYDDRIATEPTYKDNDDYINSRVATKTWSLPSKVDEDTVDGVRYRNVKVLPQRLHHDRPVSIMDAEPMVPMVTSDLVENKKRPLSVSSLSSTSMTSSPRLRKKRASAVNGSSTQVVFEGEQDLDFIEDDRPSSEEVQDSQSRLDAEERTRHSDTISSLSSESGSFKKYQTPLQAEADSSDDRSTMQSSADRTSHLQSTHPPPLATEQDIHLTSNENTAASKSKTPGRKKLTSASGKSQFVPPHAEDHVSTEREAVSSPDSLRRSSSSASRHEARMRFFTNYEEHMRQSLTNESSLAEENVNDLSEVHTQNSTATSAATTSKSAKVSLQSSSTKDSETPTSVTDDRRDRPYQFTRNSERSSRRSDRRGSATKHDGFSQSPRSGFSRSSKKRDIQTSGEAGNRSSQLYVSRVVTEIIESERTYIASLDDIIHGYLEPMENILNYTEAKKDINCLFSNIRDIYKFGCTFLADLEMAGANCVKVAQCFVNHNQGFVDTYTDYCTNYPRAVEVLTRFMQHPELSELCKERQLALGHGLPLGAYLLKPVQRILKYHLLLQNLLKKYEKEKEGSEILEQAFNHMTKIAHHINEMKRKHEHAVRIQEIQSQLEDYVGEDLTRLGELVLESAFRVYGAKASRQVFLFERGLLISKKKAGGMLSCKAFIRCSNLMLVEVIPNEPLSFHVIPFDNPRTQYTLQAHNMEQKKRWCQDIKQMILESFKGRIPDNVKNLIMQLGRDHDDDYVSKEALEAGRKNQHTAPEYLEKRRGRGKSGSRMPDFSLLKPQKAKRGGNKKNNNKTGDKSPERPHRTASKSPDGRGHIVSKRNNNSKNKSEISSLATAPGHDPPNKSQQSVPGSNNNNAPAAPRDVDYSPDSPESPVYRRSPKYPKSKDDQGDMSESEKSNESSKRPASFLMARANPILSDDITELVTRCGGSIKMKDHALLAETVIEAAYLSQTDMEDLNERNSKDSSNVTTTSDVQNNSKVDGKNHGRDRKTDDISVDFTKRNSAQTFKSSEHPSDAPKSEIYTENKLNQIVDESSIANFSTSSQKLNSSSNNEANLSKTHEKSSEPAHSENMSADNIYESAMRHMIRTHKTDQNFGPKDAPTENNDEEVENLKRESQITAFHDSHSSKRMGDNLLKRKGLRLPDTLKHLSSKEQGSKSHTYHDKAKLTNWNSMDKLTKGSMDDLSHIDEDPWIINTEVTNSELEKETQNSFKHSLGDISRPRGHSDVTEMMQVSKNKENMDWMVYLNRNSPPSMVDQSLGNRDKASTSTLDKVLQDQENSDTRNKMSSIFYATPPRKLMSSENMRKLGFIKESDKNDSSSSYKDLIWRDTSSSFPTKSINVFGTSPILANLTRPLSFNASNLLRSNSTQISDIKYNSTTKTLTKERPASADVDKLTDESKRMVAEMNEYISNSSESVTNVNKFPTIPPAIKVDEDVDSNRLSVISSISTSSYESQGSSSSDGLLETLKSRFHAWTRQPRSRNDTECSGASTLTSDDEDKEESIPSKSGNTFEPPSKNRNSWKEDRQLETVLREHSLGSSKLGSRMAMPVTQPTEYYSYSGTSVDSPYEENSSISSSVNKVPEELFQCNPQQSSSALDNHLLPTQKGEVQQSDSGFSLEIDGPGISTAAPLNNEIRSDAVLDLSETSSSEATSKFEPEVNKMKDNSNLRKSDSSESLGSNDSCYERKFSVVLDSDVFQEHPEADAPKVQCSIETVLTRKSIREHVQDLEKRFTLSSPKVLEVRRREPGEMIRQRLETLRESALHGWRNSGHGFIKPYNEASHQNQVVITAKKDGPFNSALKSGFLKSSGSCDSLSKSLNNLSRSRDNVFLSRSKDSLNSLSDIPGNRHSTPVFSFKSSNAGHERDANRFSYIAPEQNQITGGNQFMHRTNSSSQQSLAEPELQHSSAGESLQPSQSSVKEEPSKENDNLVVMKGWVRSLISKFQVK